MVMVTATGTGMGMEVEVAPNQITRMAMDAHTHKLPLPSLHQQKQHDK